jgi:membrane protease YdiL (CAAX protease family)
VRTWREMLIAIALLSLGIGVIGGFAVQWFAPSAGWAGPVATLLLWLGMLAPIAYAFARSRPIGLLRVRPVDLLFAFGLGLLLRLLQGFVAQAMYGYAPFPSYVTLDGQLPGDWWWTQALPAVVVAPVLEEFFFRAVLIVAIYTVLRRRFGHAAAGLTAGLVSTGLFLMLHAVDPALTTDGVIAVGVLGAVCALLVLLTGRIWAAVGVHVIYNATGVLLGLVGTFFG